MASICELDNLGWDAGVGLPIERSGSKTGGLDMAFVEDGAARSSNSSFALVSTGIWLLFAVTGRFSLALGVEDGADVMKPKADCVLFEV